jgi:putative N6-adenine-specific DNA methylase
MAQKHRFKKNREFKKRIEAEEANEVATSARSSSTLLRQTRASFERRERATRRGEARKPRSDRRDSATVPGAWWPRRLQVAPP